MSVKTFKTAPLEDIVIGSDYEKIGIGGFLFYASGGETSTKTATVTSNPVEDGSPVNDHIIKNPKVISIEGEVADIFIESENRPKLIQEIFPPVGIIQDYLPSRTQTQLGKINGLLATVNDFFTAADVAIGKGVQLYDFFTGVQSDTSITSKFLEFFDQVYESSSLLDVECVDTIYTNMAITSFVVNKANPNNYSFTISLSKVTEVKTTLIQLVSNASGDAKAQGADVADKGTQQTQEVDQSFASALLGALK